MSTVAAHPSGQSLCTKVKFIYEIIVGEIIVGETPLKACRRGLRERRAVMCAVAAKGRGIMLNLLF